MAKKWMPRRSNKRFKTSRRHVPGKMNGLETKFSEYLKDLERKGEVLWWAFEPARLKLADPDQKTTYTPDFWVHLKDGSMVFYETKGFWKPNARTKTKTAASKYYMFPFIGVKWKNKKWEFEEFLPKKEDK